ncbi:MAG: DUF454 family protein [Pseudomonadota bacterium]
MRTLAWTALGIVFTLIGLMGVIVPIFPGVIFMVAAAFCFLQAGRTRHRPKARRGRVARTVGRLEDRIDRAAAPALAGADRVQLGFWLLCRKLLNLRPSAGQPHNAAPANALSARYSAPDPAAHPHRTARAGLRRPGL